MRKVVLTLTLPALLFLFAGPASGKESDPSASSETESNKKEAKRLFLEGVEKFSEENYPDALSAFQESYELNPNPNVLYNIGMCHRAIFDFASSIITLKTYLEEKGGSVDKKEKAEIEEIIENMEAIVPVIHVSVSEKGATIIIDAKEVGVSPLKFPVMLNKGEHVIEVKKEGFKSENKSVVLEGSERTTIEFMLAPAAKHAPPEKFMEIDKAEKEKEAKMKKRKKILKSPLLWTLLGVALIGGGTAAGIVIWKTRSGGPMDDGDWIIHGK